MTIRKTKLLHLCKVQHCWHFLVSFLFNRVFTIIRSGTVVSLSEMFMYTCYSI